MDTRLSEQTMQAQWIKTGLINIWNIPQLKKFHRGNLRQSLYSVPKAAGVIYSDFERGFIKAETVAYEDLVELGSVAAACEKGLYRTEGKENVVKDGDVLLFKFNV